jgi:hypothetical protein
MPAEQLPPTPSDQPEQRAPWLYGDVAATARYLRAEIDANPGLGSVVADTIAITMISSIHGLIGDAEGKCRLTVAVLDALDQAVTQSEGGDL